MSNDEIAYHVIVEGRVTGVCFRWAALDYAKDLSSLRGYIRNSSYDQVEAVIQGSETHVELMLNWLRHGPSSARVDNIQINRQPISESLETFTVKA
ncbi:MAG: acylphosphatase [Victivallaceae bacterium]|nr:acylphosphatase [Victivallaceae bacterium]